MKYYDYRINSMEAMVLLYTLNTKSVEVRPEEVPYKGFDAIGLDKIEDIYSIIYEYRYSIHGIKISFIEFQFFLPLKKPNSVKNDWTFGLFLHHIGSNDTNSIKYAGYYKYAKNIAVINIKNKVM